jgi:MFS transporter, DHA2 family, multidrug resistance protein
MSVHPERTGPASTRPDGRRWAVLVLMGLALAVIVLNNSALNVALPSLMAGLGADLPTAAWIIDAYSIVFAGLLIPAGAWSDRWGRKRLTLGGLVLFGVASLVAATADAAWQLVLLRAVLGAAAAFVMPGTLAILLHAFPAREHGRAIAVWSAIAALGVAAGPILGGLLVSLGGWPAVFLLNVPLVAAVVVAGAVLVRESADPARRPTDPLGALLVVVAIGALVYTIIGLHAPGPLVLGAALLAVGAGVAFVLRLTRARHPLVEPRMLADRRVSGAAVVIMLLFLGLAGSMFVLTQRLQVRLGFEPFAAGLAVGPIALTVVAASVASVAVARRLGARAAVASGLALVAVGFGVLAVPGAGYPVIVVGLVAVGTGFGLAMPVTTAVLVSAVPHDRAGAGTAVADTMQELGFALGTAIAGAVLHRALSTAGFDDAAALALLCCVAVAVAGALVALRLLPAGPPEAESAP